MRLPCESTLHSLISTEFLKRKALTSVEGNLSLWCTGLGTLDMLWHDIAPAVLSTCPCGTSGIMMETTVGAKLEHPAPKLGSPSFVNKRAHLSDSVMRYRKITICQQQTRPRLALSDGEACESLCTTCRILPARHASSNVPCWRIAAATPVRPKPHQRARMARDPGATLEVNMAVCNRSSQFEQSTPHRDTGPKVGSSTGQSIHKTRTRADMWLALNVLYLWIDLEV